MIRTMNKYNRFYEGAFVEYPYASSALNVKINKEGE